jgi:hypothetical protein
MIGQYVALLHLVPLVAVALDCPSNATASRYPVTARSMFAALRFAKTKKDAGLYSGGPFTMRRDRRKKC